MRAGFSLGAANLCAFVLSSCHVFMKVTVSPPDEAERADLLRWHLRRLGGGGEAASHLAKLTGGRSCGELRGLASLACEAAAARAGGVAVDVAVADVDAALLRFKV